MILRTTRERRPGHGAASGGQDSGGGHGQAPGRQPRRARLMVTVCLAVVVAAGTASATYAIAGSPHPGPGQQPRPSGIPASISTRLANLMQLSALPPRAAPGFTLTDQDGRTMSLSSLRGKAVVLEFMDPHCTDICPIVAQEFVDAYHDLGPLASKVVFAAVNVNPYFRSVGEMAAFSTEHELTEIPRWHFFTGPTPALSAVWRRYNINVSAPHPDGDIIHTSAIYFIDPAGRERYLASPEVGYTKPHFAYHTMGETGYLPAGQLTGWARGITLLIRDMIR